MLRWLLPLVFLSASATVHADSLPNCPPGTHMVANPTPPGSMHHGGASCIADQETPPATEPASTRDPAETTVAETRGGCAVGHGRGDAPWLTALGLAMGLALARRRR